MNRLLMLVLALFAITVTIKPQNLPAQNRPQMKRPNQNGIVNAYLQ